ncbi:MAG: hypothetical protein J5J06_14415 [Phycisphaerae bacterium]|nr:hypothetical protein [Phycisphaerae bacterium]
MKKFVGGLALAGVVFSLAFGTMAYGKKPPRPGSGCPRTGIYCLDVWDPVICDNGVVYSNDCYAYVACATGCVPYGGETM